MKREREIYEQLVENIGAKQMVIEQHRKKKENNASYVLVEYKLNNNISRLFRRHCLHWNSFRFQCLRIDLAGDQFFFLSFSFVCVAVEWMNRTMRTVYVYVDNTVASVCIRIWFWNGFSICSAGVWTRRKWDCKNLSVEEFCGKEKKESSWIDFHFSYQFPDRSPANSQSNIFSEVANKCVGKHPYNNELLPSTQLLVSS